MESVFQRRQKSSFYNMRHLATVQEIVEIKPIEGGDAIEAVRINGWWCVSKKGEFHVGSPCVYFEIDSLLPKKNPAFEFLAKGTKEKSMVVEGVTYTGYRLKTIKLRGQVSQGLALPVSIFGLDIFNVGDDVSEMLEVVKYEAPIPAQLSGKVKGNFPEFIPKTDEERIQNCTDLLEKYKGQLFYVTEKLDGSSVTYYKKDGIFGVCSRNLELLDTEGNTLWTVAKEIGLPEKLDDGFAIQGELIGEGIQGNPLHIKGHAFYAYNVFSINESKYLDFQDFLRFCLDLQIATVPVLDPTVPLNFTLEEILNFADGHSRYAPVAREGLVFRPITEAREIINGSEGRLSFKVISNQYLLAE